ncbi:hypothetical protein [Streptomyces sp. NBC_01003]|uniref:hypothetical protein n=1 Tax=Streptomyces sp. NBC_01003 TaxID=2903714 RepID=UPI00386D84FA
MPLPLRDEQDLGAKYRLRYRCTELRPLDAALLTYGPIPGRPRLRHLVAGLYETQGPDNVLIMARISSRRSGLNHVLGHLLRLGRAEHAGLVRHQLRVAGEVAGEAADQDVGGGSGCAGDDADLVTATVTNSPLTNGRMAVANALALLADKPTPKIATAPLVLVTEKNLDHAPPYCA